MCPCFLVLRAIYSSVCEVSVDEFHAVSEPVGYYRAGYLSAVVTVVPAWLGYPVRQGWAAGMTGRSAASHVNVNVRY